MNLNAKVEFNFKSVAKFFSIKAVTRTVLVLVILFEIYLAYSDVYKNIKPTAQETITATTNIVRVNRAGYTTVNKTLQADDQFAPSEPVLVNSNPFKYSQ